MFDDNITPAERPTHGIAPKRIEWSDNSAPPIERAPKLIEPVLERLNTSVYIAGPMTGYPEYNFPAFDKAAADLRAAGFYVYNPVDKDRSDYPDITEWTEYATGTARPKFDLQKAMQWDFQSILDSDGIVLLEGWEASTGARKELEVARATGKKVFGYNAETGEAFPVAWADVDHAINCHDHRPIPREAPEDDDTDEFHILDVREIRGPDPGDWSTGDPDEWAYKLEPVALTRNANGEYVNDTGATIRKGAPVTLRDLPRVGQDEVRTTEMGYWPADAALLDTGPRAPGKFYTILAGAAIGKSTSLPLLLDEVRITDPNTGGQKGQRLARFSLLPVKSLWAIAEQFGRGALKYSDRNWERGYAWSLSYDALERHLKAWWDGEENGVDETFGEFPHLAAAGFHLLALLHFSLTGTGTDDRPKVT